MGSFIRDLRRAYPTIPTLKFVHLYEANKDSDELIDLLDLAEKEAREEEEEGNRELRELRNRLSVSEHHRLLHFVVPADVDLEHAQAIVMHGFLCPGQGVVYIGSNVLPEHHVRENVENKLGFRFSRQKYDLAVEYLKKEGVVNQQARGARAEALSLKSSSAEHGTSVHGAQIIRVALLFAHRKKR